MPIADQVSKALQDVGAQPIIARRDAATARIRGLQRELAEVRQRISLWDRVVFFSDTPDETRASELERQVSALMDERDGDERALQNALDAVAAQFPPFKLGQNIDRALTLAREKLEAGRVLLIKRVAGQDTLREALDTVGDEILARWLSGLDLLALFDQFVDGTVDGSASGLSLKDPEWGVRPVSIEELTALVAARLRSLGADQAVSRLRGQEEALEIARQRHAEAKEAVGWLDRLNIFSLSPEELDRDLAAQEFKQLQEQLESAWEKLRGTLHEGLKAYPPLALHQQVLAARSAAELLDYGVERSLDRDGDGAGVKVVTFLPVLLSILTDLRDCFHAVFPGVPLPSELGDATAPIQNEGTLVSSYLEELRQSAADHLCHSAASHTGAVGRAAWGREVARSRITFTDRLVFWRDTREEALEDTFQHWMQWHQGWASKRWDELVAEARMVGSRLGPFALRDAAVASTDWIDSIHTDGGESSFPKSCSVYNRGEALMALAGIQQVMAHFYGVDGSRDALMQAALRATPRRIDMQGDAKHGIKPLSWDDLASMLAHRLADSPFREAYRRVGERREDYEALAKQRDDVTAQISIWDRINIFSTTEEEAFREDLEASADAVEADMMRDLQLVNRLFNEALAPYPPARLSFELAGVIQAVNAITAVCRSRTVTVGSGKNKRTETRYYCALVGKSAAVKRMQHWSTNMVRAFGRLPTYHRLLEHWAAWP